MTQEEILEGNRLIIGFMEIVPRRIGISYSWQHSPYYFVTQSTPEEVIEGIVNYVKYHSDWTWLMNVVKKCLSLSEEFDDWEKHYEEIDDSFFQVEIEQTWRAVVNFIKWYNQQKEK